MEGLHPKLKPASRKDESSCFIRARFRPKNPPQEFDFRVDPRLSMKLMYGYSKKFNGTKVTNPIICKQTSDYIKMTNEFKNNDISMVSDKNYIKITLKWIDNKNYDDKVKESQKQSFIDRCYQFSKYFEVICYLYF